MRQLASRTAAAVWTFSVSTGAGRQLTLRGDSWAVSP